MPFMGLLNKHGKEIKGAGYHRLDMSDTIFKMSPPNNRTMHYVFINISMIVWPPAKQAWPEVYGCCVFSEIDDEEPVIVRKFGHSPRRLKAQEVIAIAPGQLVLEMRVNSPRDWAYDLGPPKPPGKREPSGKHARCRECGKLLTE